MVDLRTLVPLDAETVLALGGPHPAGRRRPPRHPLRRLRRRGGQRSINEELFGELEAPVRRVGAAFAPIGSASTLEAAVMPSKASIADAVRETVGR